MEYPKDSLIANRYRIVRLVGRGGMARVYEVLDLVTNRALALKTIAPEWVDDPQMCRRFVDEAILTSRLNHPRIVNVYDVGYGEEGTYLTMELLRGKTLRAEMTARKRSGRTFLLSEVKSIVGQLCDALSYAHYYTVHRDLKPENIWLGEDGNLKLMDFGLATVRTDMSRVVSARTQTGVSLGTPYYIAPEQISQPSEVTPAADQYSVAAVAYELLIGEVPAGLLKSVHQSRGDAPRSMVRALRRGLYREPERRFPSVEAFRRAFCEDQTPVKRLMSSTRGLVLAGAAVFVAGALFVSAVEQMLTLQERRVQNGTAAVERSLGQQAVLSNRWHDLNQRFALLQRREQVLGSASSVSGNTSRIPTNLSEVREVFAASDLERTTKALTQAEENLGGSLTRELQFAEMELDQARKSWERALNPYSSLLVPNLQHIADPEAWATEGRKAQVGGELVKALDAYRRAEKVYRDWTAELQDSHARTMREIAALSALPTLFTNSIGMVFARLPKARAHAPDTWVSVWETRIIDYARFVADGGSWDSRYSANERWRQVSSAQGLTFPVAGVSFSEAFRFCQWLGQRHSRHDPNAPKDMIPLLMTARVERLIENGVKDAQGPSEHTAWSLPDGVYAFGNAWPPLRNEPRFTGDGIVDAHRFIHPVASGPPNPLGLFDLESNVWEWTQTELRTAMPHWYDSTPHSKTLTGGGVFGCVTISDNGNGLYTGWPGVPKLRKVGRIEAIGFRVALVRWPGPKSIEELIVEAP